MSYLKIYPKRIIATQNTDGVFEGVITLHIEQYGLQANDNKCDVKIARENGQWQIWVQPVSGVQTPQFKQFTVSLNDYIFSVLKISPNSQHASLPKVDVFFDGIYFDMSGNEPVIKKIPTE